MAKIEQIESALNPCLISRQCPLCGDNNFELKADIHMASKIDIEKNLVNPTEGFPYAIAVCSNCGLMLNFAAYKVGLM